MTRKEKEKLVNYEKFLAYVKQKKDIGWTAKQTAMSLGMNTKEFKELKRKAKDLEKRNHLINQLKKENNRNESTD